MARGTVLHEAEQDEYRLRQECSADHTRQADAQTEYRVQADGPRPIERVGNGWASLGRVPGQVLESAEDLEEVRAVMGARDPDTGLALLKRKTQVAPTGRLPAADYVRALERRQAAAPEGSWAHRRVARMVRGVAKEPAHTVPVRDLERVAKAVGVALESVYGAGHLAYARRHAHDREVVGTRGWDLTLDVPKSVSALYALSDEDTSRRVEEAFLTSVRETVGEVEGWIARGQRGQHGDGRTARRVATSGLIGSLTLHTSARPVDGTADPHLHAHVMIANLGHGADGQWGGIASGGRELFENVPAAGALLRSRLRENLTRDLGVRWEEAAPGQWEIAGIPDQVRDLYSQRRDQAVQRAGKGATPAQKRLAARRSAASKNTSTSPTRQEWAERARRAGHDPDAVVAAALTPAQDQPEPGVTGPERRPDHEVVADRAAARLWSAHPTGAGTHARVLAAVADATSETEEPGVRERAVHHLTAAAGRTGSSGGSHLHGAQRYTAPPLTTAQARTGQGPAARAAEHTVADLTARRALAQAQAEAARRSLRELGEATHKARAAWKKGTTKKAAQQEQERLYGVLHEATRTVAHLEGQIRQVRDNARETDYKSAQAQQKAAEALQGARIRAHLRTAALQAGRHTGPLHRTGRTPGLTPRPITPRHRRGPESGRGGPGLGR